ncbi:unnamed protein product [Effrenium voratum]|nr:unnamed protein product [Effrenium voratum]
MTNMSAFWTAIPMFLTGAGEILVNPVVYQYVFEEAPAPLRSMLQALNLVAAGSISNAITAALSPLVPENLNDGHLVYFFYANCILAVLALLVFLRLPQNDREAAGGLRNLWPRESFKGAVCACWTLKAMFLSTMPSFCDTK